MISPLPDFGLIAGEAVTVRTPTITYDEHMEESTIWTETTVANVLVMPGVTSDVTDSTRLHGTRVAFTLGFPKTFTALLRGCRVVVRGTEYDVIGDPQPATASNLPSPWSRTVEVEAADG
jgi:hypothetical protein